MPEEQTPDVVVMDAGTAEVIADAVHHAMLYFTHIEKAELNLALEHSHTASPLLRRLSQATLMIQELGIVVDGCPDVPDGCVSDGDEEDEEGD